MRFDKAEKKYFIMLAVLLLVFGLIMSKYQDIFNNYSPIVQFLIFNLGIYFLIFFVLKAVATKTHIAKLVSFSILLIFFAFDLIMPEYHVNIDGTLIPGAVFGLGASDYAIGSLGQALGLQGSIFGLSYIWLFTYFFVPLILIAIAAYYTRNLIHKL